MPMPAWAAGVRDEVVDVLIGVRGTESVEVDVAGAVDDAKDWLVDDGEPVPIVPGVPALDVGAEVDFGGTVEVNKVVPPTLVTLLVPTPLPVVGTDDAPVPTELHTLKAFCLAVGTASTPVHTPA